VNNRGHVFISYSSKDRLFVNDILKMFDEMGIEYWIAPERIGAGSNYAREIPKAIQECEFFLLFLSKSSQESIWVEKEVDSAINQRKEIIPLQMDSIPLNDVFRFYLNNVQMIPYQTNPTFALESLKVKLHKLLPAEDEDKKADDLTKNSQKTVIKADEKEIVNVSGASQAELSALQQERIARMKKLNALSINQVPVVCEYCGGDVEKVTMGTFKCLSCGRENYDDFQKIRNYLNKSGARSMLDIRRETGVPRTVIEHFFKHEYLEIPSMCSVRLSCEGCGAPIRTGTLCDRCKMNRGSMVNTDRMGNWHTR